MVEKTIRITLELHVKGDEEKVWNWLNSMLGRLYTDTDTEIVIDSWELVQHFVFEFLDFLMKRRRPIRLHQWNSDEFDWNPIDRCTEEALF